MEGMNNILFAAVKLGRLDTIRSILDMGENVNAKNSNGNTLLHEAALHDQEDILNFLIETAGADLNVENSDGNYPLHVAAISQKDRIVNCLLELGIDINTKNSHGNTPLHLTILHRLPLMVKFLLDTGADINFKNSDGNTPLHLAVQKPEGFILKLLIDAGANLNLQNNNDETALVSILSEDSPWLKLTVMKMLIVAGSDVNSMSNVYGSPVLAHALDAGDVEFVQFLINHGANVNLKYQSDERTALHSLAETLTYRNLNVLDVLLTANADINAKNKENETPLHSLIRNSRIPSSVFSKALKIFSKYNADFEAKDNRGLTPVDYALRVWDKNVWRELIMLGKVDVNRKFKSEKNDSILHIACENYCIPIIKLLLKNGADINIVDRRKEPPLICVMKNMCRNLSGHARVDPTEHAKSKLIFEYLLEWNPDVNAIMANGKNILTHLSRYYVLSDDAWKGFLRHLAKLQMNNQTIHPSILETISTTSKYQSFFENCMQELEIIKNSKLHDDCWVTFWNILIDDKQKLVNYAGNIELMKEFASEKFLNFTEKFPIYSDLIHNRFSKAIRKREISSGAAKRISNFFITDQDIGIEHDAVLKILSYLDSTDLENLCHA